MNKTLRRAIVLGTCLYASASFAVQANDPAFDAELLTLQQAWAHANYEIACRRRARAGVRRAREARRRSSPMRTPTAPRR